MIKNIAFYHFFKPDFDLETAKDALRLRMLELGIRGSILLAQEGINGSFAGPDQEMDVFMTFLLETVHLKNPVLKISYTDDIPFKRTLVKVKPEIVAEPGKDPVNLKESPAPHLPPEELNQWLKENKDIVLLDTRNDYEFEAGRFKNAVHLGTKHFADFEEDLKKAP